MTDRKTRAMLGYLSKEAGLFLLFCYLLFIAGTSNGVANYDLVRLGMAVLSVVVTAWLVLKIGWSRTSAAPTPLSIPIGIFLAVYALAAIASIDPRRSAGEVWLAGLYMFIFAVTSELVVRGWPRELFVKALLLVGGIVLGLGWYSALGWYRQWLQAAPGEWIPTITYRSPVPNTLATFLNLLLLPALARLFATRARAPRLLLAVWAVAGLGLIFLTSSRGGWLGTLAGVGAVVGIGLRDEGARLRALWIAMKRQRVALALAVMVGLIGTMVVGFAAYRLVAHPTHGPLLVSREQFWGPAWTTFLSSPWLGQGPFTYASAYMRANSVPPNPSYLAAHSVFFNLLSEAGILGVLAFTLLVVAAFRLIWRRLTDTHGGERAAVIGAGAALVTYAVHGLSDSVNMEPANAITAAILLGVALAPKKGQDLPPTKLQRNWPLGLAILLVVSGWYGVWLSAPLRAGVTAANQLDWKEATLHFSEAAHRDPRSAVVHQQLGLANSILAAQGAGGALERAIAAFETTVATDPDWALNHANLGVLYAAHGDTALALAELQAAASRASGVALYHLNLGLVAERVADDELSERAYATALDLRPEWAAAYFWRATPFRERVLAAWRAAALQAPAPTVDELEATIASNPYLALPYAQLAEEYIQLGLYAEAAVLLQKAELAFVARDEDILEVRWVRAELAAAQGDWRAATALGEGALDGYRMQSIFGPGSFGMPVYGQFLFRREAMAVDIVPQMTIIVLTDPWADRMVRLAEWYEAAGDPARAKAIYKEVLTYVPDHAGAQNRLVEVR